MNKLLTNLRKVGRFKNKTTGKEVNTLKDCVKNLLELI